MGLIHWHYIQTMVWYDVLWANGVEAWVVGFCKLSYSPQQSWGKNINTSCWILTQSRSTISSNCCKARCSTLTSDRVNWWHSPDLSVVTPTSGSMVRHWGQREGKLQHWTVLQRAWSDDSEQQWPRWDGGEWVSCVTELEDRFSASLKQWKKQIS